MSHSTFSHINNLSPWHCLSSNTSNIKQKARKLIARWNKQEKIWHNSNRPRIKHKKRSIFPTLQVCFRPKNIFNENFSHFGHCRNQLRTNVTEERNSTIIEMFWVKLTADGHRRIFWKQNDRVWCFDVSLPRLNDAISVSQIKKFNCKSATRIKKSNKTTTTKNIFLSSLVAVNLINFILCFFLLQKLIFASFFCLFGVFWMSAKTFQI